jgi:MarR family transcriptional regulator, multiple antibiotic resistance protein MarR
MVVQITILNIIMAITLPHELDQSLGYNLDRAAVLLRRELIRAFAPEGLLPEQWQILIVLADAKELSQQQLADALLADKHAMSRMLARMERDGWIQRKPSPVDSRSQRVRLTRKSRQRLAPMVATVRARFKKRLAPISQEDRTRLRDLLRQLTTTLRDTPSPPPCFGPITPVPRSFWAPS